MVPSEYQLAQLEYGQAFFPISLTKALWRNSLSDKALPWQQVDPHTFQTPVYGGLLTLGWEPSGEIYRLSYRCPALSPQDIPLRVLTDPGHVHTCFYDLPQVFWGLVNGALSRRVEPDFLHSITLHLTAIQNALSDPGCQYRMQYRRPGQPVFYDEDYSAGSVLADGMLPQIP